MKAGIIVKQMVLKGAIEVLVLMVFVSAIVKGT